VAIKMALVSVKHAEKVEEMYPPSLDGEFATDGEGGHSRRHQSNVRLF